MGQAPVQRHKPRPATPREPPEDAGTTWKTAVSRFLADCRRRILAPATTDTYASILTNARTEQFRADYDILTAADLTADNLKAFETDLLVAGLSTRSVTGYHRVLKTFASFCIQEGYATDDTVLRVVGPKLEQFEPETFTPVEEKQLLAAADTERDRLLVAFMLATGLRLQEVVQVTIDDIVESPSGAYVRVRQGKGRNRLSQKLLRYAQQSRPKGSDERALFLSFRSGPDGSVKPLTARGIQIVLYRLGQLTGIHVYPHKFRHTFATRALSAGVDVMALQKALGHTTLAMVSPYVHYQKDDLLEAWRRRRD